MPWRIPKYHHPWRTLKNCLEVSLIILNVVRRSLRKLVWQFLSTPSSILSCWFQFSSCVSINYIFKKSSETTFPISVANVHQRHQILENSIGALPQEQEAYKTLLILVSSSIPGLVIASIFQFMSYYCFHRFFHPFKAILHHPKKVPIELQEL